MSPVADLLVMFLVGVAFASLVWGFLTAFTRCERDGARMDNERAREVLRRTSRRLVELGVPEDDRLVMDAEVTLLLGSECR